MLARTLLLSLLITTPIAATAQTVFMVQLGTFDSEDKAQERWGELSKQFPDVFQSLKYTPNEVVKHPDNFVSYRTQAGPISSREEAEAICAEVSSKGAECYVAETAMFSTEDAEVATAAPAIAPPSPPSPAPAAQPQVAAVTPPVTQAQVAAPAPAPIPASPLPAGYVPSPYATPSNPVTSAQSFTDPYAVADAQPAQAYVPQNAQGTVAVQEAIPVPLSEPVSNPYLERGNRLMNASPNDSSAISSFWADIGSFRSEAAAIQYVQVLKSRDDLLPRTLRIRVTRPFGNATGEAQMLSLRMGPFVTTVPIRRICSLTRAENLRCRAVKDLGGSVQNTSRYAVRQQANRGQLTTASTGAGRYAGYRQNVQQRQTTSAPTTQGYNATSLGQYHVQLGSFLSPQAAEGKWQELVARHGGLMQRATKQVVSPNGSNGRLFRLRTTAFPDFLSANNFCNALKAGGTLCIVVK
jgi:SPOR domain